MVRKAGDWRKNIEANSRLMKKFEESRAELEKVIQIANCCLKEKGNPEELLRKHSVSKFSDFSMDIFNYKKGHMLKLYRSDQTNTRIKKGKVKK